MVGGMSDQTPPQAGFIRLAVLLERDTTPGELARQSGVDPEFLGLITIDHGQAAIDIHEDHAQAARERLKALGPTQLQSRSRPPEPTWRWLRLAVGRNHGMTIGQFKRIMERSPAERLGKIHLNNTHTLVGIREDLYAAVVEYFRDQRINGIAVRPGDPLPGETFDNPAFTGSGRSSLA